MSRIFLVIIVALNHVSDYTAIVNGLRCYECMSTSDSSPCIYQTGSVSECDSKYCTIYREELVDPVGHLINFYRLCQDNPKYFNTVIKTLTHKIYYQACMTDLCNKGDGTDYDVIPNDKVNGMHSSSKNIHTVPGIESALQLTNHIIMLIIIVVVILI